MPFVEVDGRKIHYRDNGGRGPALLLFHPFPFDGSVWERQLEALADRFRVLAPDLSGFGASTVPEDPASYSVERWADEGRAVLDTCGVERAIVGGCSMGGYVTFAFARRHPDRIRALLLVDTRAEADAEQVRENRRRQQAMVREGQTGRLLDELHGRLLSSAGAADERLSADVRRRMEQPPAGIVGALDAMIRRPDSTGLLPRIDRPTLVVVGAEDRITPPPVLDAIAGAIPRARLVVIPECGHLPQIEAPEAFHEALGFLAQEA